MKRTMGLVLGVVALFAVSCSKQAVPVAPSGTGNVSVSLQSDGTILGGPALLRLAINDWDIKRIEHESWLPGPGSYLRVFFVPPGPSRLFTAVLISERTTELGGVEFDLSHLAAKEMDIGGGEVVGLVMRPLTRMTVEQLGQVDLSANDPAQIDTMLVDFRFFVSAELSLIDPSGLQSICFLGREGIDPIEKLVLVPTNLDHYRPNSIDAKAFALADQGVGGDLKAGDWYGIRTKELGGYGWVRVKKVDLSSPLVIDYFYRPPASGGDGENVSP